MLKTHHLMIQRFHPTWCDEIIKRGMALRPADAGIGADATKPCVDSAVRRSKTSWILHDDSVLVGLYPQLYRAFHEANAAAFDVATSLYIPSVQFTVYDETDQGHYDWHIDAFLARDVPYAQDRKLSMVIQLSHGADYEGGDFEVEHAYDERDVRDKGTAIVFPSICRHRVTPVTKGTRYSLVAWLEGPAWR